MRVQRVLQIVADNTSKPFSELRILDLACYEGEFALEFARRGASVVGIEGRSINIEKAIAAKETLNLSNVAFFQDDVRNLSREKYGAFDVVLCLGMLYHLDTPDVFEFLEKMVDVCEGITVIDTHFSAFPILSRTYNGKTYWGRIFVEHTPESSTEQRLKDTWQSLDNLESFWLTRASLFNALSEVGFTSAYECGFPTNAKEKHDRAVFLARKGERCTSQPYPPVPEISGVTLFLYRFYRRFVRPIVRIFRKPKSDSEQSFGFWGRHP